MQTGTAISGAAHLGVIAWVLIGGTLFRPDPAPVETVTNVSLVSSAALDAALSTSPQVSQVSPAALAPEPAVEVAPEVAQTPDRPAPPPRPEPNVAPSLEPLPTIPTPPPLPEAEVVDTPPDLTIPVESEAPPLPQPPAPAARPVPRVAPTPQAPPPPEATPDSLRQAATAPTPAPDAVEQEATEETAPEEATTRIVTEAEEGEGLAPPASARPQARPQRPPQPQVAQEETTPPPADDPTPSALNDALAEALSDAAPAPAAPAAPAGPPLTRGERDALRVAVSACWNVGSLSSEALRTTVTIGVSMNQDGTPQPGSIRLIAAEGGSNAAANQAYEAARRAIIRCGARGYGLPLEKYAQWQEIEMTFNPEQMRIR